MSEKAVLLEEDSNEALKRFEPESLDFIFIDTYMTYVIHGQRVVT